MTALSRESLGTAILRARTAAGLTQGQLGELTGLGQPLISRIEMGTRKIDLVELVRVAAVLELTVDTLIANASASAPAAPLAEEAELVALRLAAADDSTAQALGWVPDFLRRLRRLERLDDQQ